MTEEIIIKKKRESRFDYCWNEGGIYGDVTLYCECGCDSKQGQFDTQEEENVLTCPVCEKKYKIMYREWIEEINK